MQHSDQINELASALAKAQGAMTNVKKDKTVTIRSEKGNYSYNYADVATILDAVRKPFSENGLSIVQTLEHDGEWLGVETSILHTSGQWMAHAVGTTFRGGDPKALGSHITYMRRYGLIITGVVTDDDDEGDAAVQPTKRPAQAQRPQPQPAAPAVPPANGNGHAPEQKPEPAGILTMTEAQLTEAPSDAEFDTLPNAAPAVAIRERVVGKKRADETKAHPDIMKTFKKNLAIAIGSSEERHAFTKFMFGSDDPEQWTQGQCMAGNTFLDVGTAGKDENGKANWAPGQTFMRDWPIIKAAIMPAVEIVGK